MMVEIRNFQEIVANFRHMRVDSTEFACLKAIVLFKTGKEQTKDFISRVTRVMIDYIGVLKQDDQCLQSKITHILDFHYSDSRRRRRIKESS